MIIKTRILREADAQGSEGGGGEAAPVEKNFGYDEPADVIEEDTDSETAPAAPANPAPTEQPPAQAAATQAPEAPAAEPIKFDWKNELKGLDRTEVLKELGLDEFTLGLLEYKEKTGDLAPYLEAKTIDYGKLSHEDILKMDMRKQNPSLSDQSLNFKFNRELNEKYFLDRYTYPEGSDEANYGEEQLRLDAENVRKQLIENQAKFRAPEKAADPSTEQREADRARVQQALKGEILNNPASVYLKEKKALTFGEGDATFTYPLENVDDLISETVDVFQNSGRADLKDIDLKDYYQKVAVGANLPAFLESYGKHQRALAKIEFQSEMHNTRPPADPASPSPEPGRNYAYNGG